MATLRDRCAEFLAGRSAPLVDDLVSFILAERGRAAAPDELDESEPLVLYFHNARDRQDFLNAWRSENPFEKIIKTP